MDNKKTVQLNLKQIIKLDKVIKDRLEGLIHIKDFEKKLIA